MLRLPEHKEVNVQRNRPGGNQKIFHRDGLFLGKVIAASFTGVYIGDEFSAAMYNPNVSVNSSSDLS